MLLGVGGGEMGDQEEALPRAIQTLLMKRPVASRVSGRLGVARWEEEAVVLISASNSDFAAGGCRPA